MQNLNTIVYMSQPDLTNFEHHFLYGEGMSYFWNKKNPQTNKQAKCVHIFIRS